MERSTGDFRQGTNLMKIDDLQYQYAGNKLTSIRDNQQNSTGYPYLSSPNTIQYDNDSGEGNGNMIKHMDKGISQIKYNYLNLSSSIIKNNMQMPKGNSTTYHYDSNGIKLKKLFAYYKVDPMGGGITNAVRTTEYLDGFQYSLEDSGFSCVGCPSSQPTLQFIPTAEGYYNFENNKYIYNYVDHLGNTRLSYFNNGNSIEVLEENNYYPFGLKHEGYNPLAGNPVYQYKYNGKELQESGMYDYGARMYMPDIARWNAVDPKSQYTHELYSYVWNNPISYNDPTGMFGEMYAFPINDGLKDGQVWEDTDGKFYWDMKRGVWRDFNDGSSVITQVSILVQSKNGTGANLAAMTLVGTANGEHPGGWALLIAAAAYATYYYATKPKIEWYTPLPEHTTIADPGVGMRNLKTEDTAEEDATGDVDDNGIVIPDEHKIPRDSLNPPKKPGNAPTFKKDGKSVEIHHEDQNANGPFREMHPHDHRGKGNYTKNHPPGNTPLTKEERKRFNNQREAYWKKEYPNKK